MLVSLSVLWGGSFFFIEVALRALPALTIVALRLVLAAAVLVVVARFSGARLPATAGVWIALFCMGLLNNVLPFSLIVWGQTHITGGVASILNATAPLFAVVIANLFTADEKLTAGKLAGVVLGIAGVGVMMGPSSLQSLGVTDLAQLAVLGASLSYALAGVYGRRFQALGLAPLATATGQVIAAAAIMLPLALAIDRPWTLPAPPVEATASIAALAVLSTALAYVLYFRLLATAGATNLLLVTFLIPITAIVLGVLFLGERLCAGQLLGMVLIGGGLATIDGRVLRLAIRRFGGEGP